MKGVKAYFQLGPLLELLNFEISETPRAGFETVQSLSSGFAE